MVRVSLLALKLNFLRRELLPCLFVNVVCIDLKGKFIVNDCSQMFKVSDLLHFLPLHDSRTEDGPYAACFHPTTQTQLRGRTDIKVKEAAVKPSGKVVNVLRIGSAVDILQAGGQGHVISILIIILYE